MEVLGGGEFHARSIISEGCPALCSGVKTLGDKIEDSGVFVVVSEHLVAVFSRSAFLASAVEGLKSDAARA